MRKSIGLLALLVCAVILSACGQESVHEKQTSLTYSNLVDTGSRAQLAQLLADAGISEQSISGLMSNIIHFNQTTFLFYMLNITHFKKKVNVFKKIY